MRAELRNAASGREAIAQTTRELEDAAERLDAAALDDPVKQQEILNPGTLPFTLYMDDESEIALEIPKTFSIADTLHRRVLDHIEVMAKMVRDDLRTLRPDVTIDQAYMNAHPGTVELALATPNTRDQARKIIAMLARTVPDGGRVTEAQLVEGLSPQDLITCQLWFLLRLGDEVARQQKKAADRAKRKASD